MKEVESQKANRVLELQKIFDPKRFEDIKSYVRFFTFLFLSLGLLVTDLSQAKNLGVWGATFPVVEQDIREFIYKRLNHMQKNGEMKKLKARFVKNVKEHTLRPVPVEGLTTTDKPKIFYYDPTYILDRNIEDDKGRVIAKAGTTINPLDTITLHGVLFFLNTDDKRQIKWALKNVKKYDYVKYILVKGNIKDAGELLSDRIYFDQYGLMTSKFGIKHIPCIVKQADRKLQIKEFALKAEVNKSKRSRKTKEKQKNRASRNK